MHLHKSVCVHCTNSSQSAGLWIVAVVQWSNLGRTDVEVGVGGAFLQLLLGLPQIYSHLSLCISIDFILQPCVVYFRPSHTPIALGRSVGWLVMPKNQTTRHAIIRHHRHIPKHSTRVEQSRAEQQQNQLVSIKWQSTWGSCPEAAVQTIENPLDSIWEHTCRLVLSNGTDWKPVSVDGPPYSEWIRCW